MLINRIIVGSMFTNAYVVSTGKKECILIDPGADTPAIVQRLETMNLIPQAIVFTHGHIDHTSAARGIQEHYTGRSHHVPVGIHSADVHLIGNAGYSVNHEIFDSLGENALSAFESFGDELPDPEFTFKEGDAILDTDLTVMHTGGHSPGSSCFYSESRQAVFTGDILFFNTIGRSDFPDGDGEQIMKSVTDRLFALPQETRVFPGHGPLTTIERERMNNPLQSDGATI